LIQKKLFSALPNIKRSIPCSHFFIICLLHVLFELSTTYICITLVW
jgi:hypothetical protein